MIIKNCFKKANKGATYGPDDRYNTVKERSQRGESVYIFHARRSPFVTCQVKFKQQVTESISDSRER